jgi:SAM-dependent methyltransferase
MKLNLGCGRRRYEDFLNVDAAPECEPDLVFDVETFPWPWDDDSVEAVRFIHSLEHMGAEPRVFLKLMQELYRVCRPGALVEIAVPHPRSDTFIGDPTHVRIISPDVLNLFDRQLNAQWQAEGTPNTPLALYTQVDFRLAAANLVLAEPYSSQHAAGALDREALNHLLATQNNIAQEWQLVLEVVKPLR